MPELPEVETIRRGLQRELAGRRITRVYLGKARLRSASPVPLSRLEGRAVVEVGRHGKFLAARLSEGSLVLHLGMTGKLLFAAPGDALRPHTHVRLGLDDGRELRFVDPRRFGSMTLHPDGPLAPFLRFGPDALDPAFTPGVLAASLADSGAPLKAFLLDQGRVAGLGNIYAAEALWRARLSPRRLARNTPESRVPLLHAGIRAVLEESLRHGGTSFNDYVDHIGQPGEFWTRLAVFQREGEPCPRCACPVRRIVQSGRSTFFCPACQR